MKLENEFTVDAPVDEAWKVMMDLERVTPCLPGASLKEQTGDGEHKGAMRVKLGPVTQDFEGTVSYEETDESAHRAVLKADGKDARGQGTASATITSTLHEENGGGSTRVHVETDMQLSGRIAQFGGGIHQDVAEKIMGRFAECLEKEILGGGAEEETSEAPSANGGTTTERRQPEAAQAEEQDSEGVEALDLGEVSQDAVMKRVKPLVPIVAGVGAVLLVIWLLKRGSSGSSGGGEWSGGWSGSRGEVQARLRF